MGNNFFKDIYKYMHVYIYTCICIAESLWYNRVLPREQTGHSKHSLPTAQEKTLHIDIIRWLTLKSDWLYSLQSKMVKLYTVKTRPGADCGSDHKPLLKNSDLTWRKWGKPLSLSSMT